MFATFLTLNLYKNDEQLKSVDQKWLLPKNEEIETVKKALEAKKYKVDVVEDEVGAVELIKNTIPDGASVYSAGKLSHNL